MNRKIDKIDAICDRLDDYPCQPTLTMERAA